ncbi:DUF485 domain-containing protein, partial [Pantoea agglomerans]|nr:DUF485 domain-containing protein [Pantoea agglomerans]
TPVSTNDITISPTPIGIPRVTSFVLTGVYVWRANGEFDRLTKAILSEVKS